MTSSFSFASRKSVDPSESFFDRPVEALADGVRCSGDSPLFREERDHFCDRIFRGFRCRVVIEVDTLRHGSGVLWVRGFFDEPRFGESVIDRNACRDFQLDNFFVGKAIQFHDDGAKGVTVSRDQYVFPLLKLRDDFLFEVRERSCRSHGQAFASGRCHVVATAPDFDLVGTEFFSHFRFIFSLEFAVHPFVEFPGTDDRDSGVFGFFAVDFRPILEFFVFGMEDEGDFSCGVFAHCEHGRHLGAYECGGEDDVYGEVFDFFACIEGFVDPFDGKGNIDPACEDIELIPDRLAVPQ